MPWLWYGTQPAFAANGRIAVSSTPCRITRAIKRHLFIKSLFRSLTLHHVLWCKHRIVARRHGANGHRDAYLVRCGHLRGHPHLWSGWVRQTDTDRRAGDESRRQQQQPPGAGNQDEGHESQDATMRETETARRKAGLPLLVLRDGSKARQSGGRWLAWDWPIQRNKVRHDAAARQVWAHSFDKGARRRLERRLCVASPRRGSAQQIGWRRGHAQHPGLAGIHRQQDSMASSVVGGTDQGGSRTV
ncbi:hypothetical protein V8C34DRAFT_276076 [Trichoderma compactum]